MSAIPEGRNLMMEHRTYASGDGRAEWSHATPADYSIVATASEEAPARERRPMTMSAISRYRAVSLYGDRVSTGDAEACFADGPVSADVVTTRDDAIRWFLAAKRRHSLAGYARDHGRPIPPLADAEPCGAGENVADGGAVTAHRRSRIRERGAVRPRRRDAGAQAHRRHRGRLARAVDAGMGTLGMAGATALSSVADWPRMIEKTHYRTFEAALGGHWKLMSHRECTCTTATIPTYTMGERPGVLVLRSACASCERNRLWSRLMIRLNVPHNEAMEIAWACPAEQLSGLFRVLDGDDPKRSYEQLRDGMERSDIAS